MVRIKVTVGGTEFFNNVETIYIKSGAIVERDISVTNNLVAKGSYSLDLEYQCPEVIIRMRVGQNQEIWGNPITSNIITIEIRAIKKVSGKDNLGDLYTVGNMNRSAGWEIKYNN